MQKLTLPLVLLVLAPLDCAVAQAQPPLGAEDLAPVRSWFPKAPALPRPTEEVIEVSDSQQLQRAVRESQPGQTILLADGLYRLSSRLNVRTDGASIRSASGNREKVILDGTSVAGGELVEINARDVTLANLTLQNVRWNAVKIGGRAPTEQVTIYNCVLHNIWQRGIKASHVQQEELRTRGCRVQFCLFYNDHPKRYADDPADTHKNFRGNYIGGIDVKDTIGWTISDNAFVSIQGRSREGRGAVYISERGSDCVIERNLFVNCDIAVALGNPSLPFSPIHAVDCVVRNNFLANCPETGILACHTKNCQILHNTIHDPDNKYGRLIFIQLTNDHLVVANNLLSGPEINKNLNTSSNVKLSGNVVRPDLTHAFVEAAAGNLHLENPPVGIVDAATRLPLVSHDIDNQPRLNRPDVGADEMRFQSRSAEDE